MTRETILIIDDTPANLGILTESLEQRGYEILAANEGAPGFELRTAPVLR